jgi:nicotinate phosphoribosyltransferase
MGGVRIDCGDLATLCPLVRRILDEGGCRSVKIFVSGGLDELTIANLLAEGVPVDGFGVGTSLDASADEPVLDCAYKLQEYAGRATRKRSAGKATWPGIKQVERHRDGNGALVRDEVVLERAAARGERLLVPVMRGGRRAGSLPTLGESRERAARELARLPAPLRSLTSHAPYEVEISPAIRDLADSLDRT